jgi:hypothetical protein
MLSCENSDRLKWIASLAGEAGAWLVVLNTMKPGRALTTLVAPSGALTSSVRPVTVSRRNTSLTPLVSRDTRLVAIDHKKT